MVLERAHFTTTSAALCCSCLAEAALAPFWASAKRWHGHPAHSQVLLTPRGELSCRQRLQGRRRLLKLRHAVCW